MREILFRGKTPNGEWVEGYYGQFHNRPAVNEPNSHQIFEPKENAVVFGSCIGGLWHKVIPETVGQYTGLTDRNDKKIFEGDIVKINLYEPKGLANYEIDYIKYDYFKTRFVFCTDEGDYGIDITCVFEVIGNIHDNPELLKGGAE